MFDKLTQRSISSTIEGSEISSSIFPVGVCAPEFVTGSRKVPNSEILTNFPGRESDEIYHLTGIKNRFWLSEGETLVSIATQASLNALEKSNLKLQDIDYIICATCSPDEYLSPSVACSVLYGLYNKFGEHHIAAVDINAACTGYIYALQQANDYLKDKPNKRVLAITAEAMSKKIDHDDFNTAFLFADAATATIVVGNDYLSTSKAKIRNITLSANGGDPDILSIPLNDTVILKGKQLFMSAVKYMSKSLHQCCQQLGLEFTDLDTIIPHQANQRITSAIEKKLKFNKNSLYSNIENYGNTSSSTIPIAMSESAHRSKPGANVALCAFGGGFTHGTVILEIL